MESEKIPKDDWELYQLTWKVMDPSVKISEERGS